MIELYFCLKHDVIPESLKNMLLVMETTGLFNKDNSDIKFSQLCGITKDRIESFLPGLWEDLFRSNCTSLSPVLNSPKELAHDEQSETNQIIDKAEIPTQVIEEQNISPKESAAVVASASSTKVILLKIF